MNSYIKLSGAIVLLALAGNYFLASPTFAATIPVTTTTDEDSEPAAGTGCSFYEAIQSSNNDAAYGGCIAGSGVDTISLPSGTYDMPLGNTWSNTITASSPVTITGPSTGAKPIISGLTKTGPSAVLNLNASNITISNIDLRGYYLQNFDSTHSNSYPNLTLDNIALSADAAHSKSFDTNCDGLRANNITLEHRFSFDVYGNDAIVTNVVGSDFAWLETGVDSNNDRGGDDITVQNVNFTDNSSFYFEKNGPGDLLVEDASIDAASGDAINIFTYGSTDDGTTTFRNLSVTGTVTDNAIVYDNYNDNAQHVLRIEDSYFANNDAGIMFNNQPVSTATPTLTIVNTLFQNNGSFDSALSIYEANAYVTIDRSSFVGNHVDGWVGSAIYSEGRLDMTNSVLYDNSPVSLTGFPGGAVYVAASTHKDNADTPMPSKFTNNTFANNDAESGGALYVADYNDGTSSRDLDMVPVMINNLFSNNGTSACQAGSKMYAPSSNRYVLTFGSGSASNMSTDNSCGDAVVQSNVGVDTALTDTTTNTVGYQGTGGHTKMLQLLTGSPAIDSGTNAGCTDHDITLNSRPIGTICDIGAFETTSSGVTPPTTPSSSHSDGPGDVPLAPDTGSGYSFVPSLFSMLILPMLLVSIGMLVSRAIFKPRHTSRIN
jgi:hypothetical protein